MPPVVIEIVEGYRQAAAAGVILREAWSNPSIHYSTEYLDWQLGYPGAPVSLPAALASENGEPVGFAGTTVRRVRQGSRSSMVAVVSFVGVRGRWQRQGVASRLYAALLGALAQTGLPVLTFAVAGSAGETTLLRAYPASGFIVQKIGSYPIFGYMRRAPAVAGEWTLLDQPGLDELQQVVEQCAATELGLAWPEWTPEQWVHLSNDPRPRRLLVARHSGGMKLAAAWAVQSAYRNNQGIDRTAVLENLLVPGQNPEPIPLLLEAAATLWSPADGQPHIVMLANPGGFPAETFRRLGIRQTGTIFQGYACHSPEAIGWESVHSTAVEVV